MLIKISFLLRYNNHQIILKVWPYCGANFFFFPQAQNTLAIRRCSGRPKLYRDQKLLGVTYRPRFSRWFSFKHI